MGYVYVFLAFVCPRAIYIAQYASCRRRIKRQRFVLLTFCFVNVVFFQMLERRVLYCEDHVQPIAITRCVSSQVDETS